MSDEAEVDECQDCHGLMGISFCCACGKFLDDDDDEEYPA